MYFQPFFSKIPAIVSLDSRWHFMKKLQLTLVILSCVRCMIMHYKYKGVIKSRLITLHSILRKNLTYLLSWKLEFHSKLFLLNYSDLLNNHAANFIPIIGIKFAAWLFGRSEYISGISSLFINKFVQKCQFHYTLSDERVPLVTVKLFVFLLKKQLWISPFFSASKECKGMLMKNVSFQLQ